MQATVLAISQQLAIPALPQALAFERVYRALGPPSVNVDRPRDVIGRFHQYAHKESINSKAWEKGDLELDRSGKTFTLTTLRATLQRRAMLRPLLDKIKWGEPTGGGTPLHLIVKKKKKYFLTFNLRHLGELPDFFSFMEMEAIEIPNWLQQIPGSLRKMETMGVGDSLYQEEGEEKETKTPPP